MIYIYLGRDSVTILEYDICFPGGQCTQLGNIVSCGSIQTPHSMHNIYIMFYLLLLYSKYPNLRTVGQLLFHKVYENAMVPKFQVRQNNMLPYC